MDCKGCGKCCILVDPALDVQIYQEDVNSALKDKIEFRRGYKNVMTWWMKRNSDGSCVALDPITMQCTIYDFRPKECIEFSQNDPLCNRILMIDSVLKEAHWIEKFMRYL